MTIMNIVRNAALGATAIGAGVATHQLTADRSSGVVQAGMVAAAAVGTAGLMAMSTRIGFRFVVVPSFFLHPPTLLSHAGGFAAAGAAGALVGAALAQR